MIIKHVGSNLLRSHEQINDQHKEFTCQDDVRLNSVKMEKESMQKGALMKVQNPQGHNWLKQPNSSGYLITPLNISLGVWFCIVHCVVTKHTCRLSWASVQCPWYFTQVDHQNTKTHVPQMSC